ncbi:hypothetical protein HDU96_002419 [Phlyctochytrium bullatum]|nr:hypothetical protein HDU96_002419 [Phlyctochytrium bullatum]
MDNRADITPCLKEVVTSSITFGLEEVLDLALNRIALDGVEISLENLNSLLTIAEKLPPSGMQEEAVSLLNSLRIIRVMERRVKEGDAVNDLEKAIDSLKDGAPSSSDKKDVRGGFCFGSSDYPSYSEDSNSSLFNESPSGLPTFKFGSLTDESTAKFNDFVFGKAKDMAEPESPQSFAFGRSSSSNAEDTTFKTPNLAFSQTNPLTSTGFTFAGSTGSLATSLGSLPNVRSNRSPKSKRQANKMNPEPGPFGSSAALSISKDPPRGSHEDMLLVACMVGNPKAVLVLAQGPVKDPGFGNQTPLLVASRLGHGECVRNLLTANPSAVDPTAISCLALRVACRAGHAEVVEALLDDGRVDPSVMNSEALRAACWAPLDNAGRWGSKLSHRPTWNSERAAAGLRIAKRLMADPRVDVTANNFFALRRACSQGHLELVQEFLKHPQIAGSDGTNPVKLGEEVLFSALIHRDVALAVLAHPSFDFTGEVLLWTVEMTNAEAVRILLAREDSAQALETARPFLFRSLIRGAALKSGWDSKTGFQNPFSDVARAALASPGKSSDAGQKAVSESAAIAPGETAVVTQSASDAGESPTPFNAETAWRNDTLETMRILVSDDRININADFDYLFRFSIFYDRTYLVEELLKDPRIDPRIKNYEAIRLVKSVDMARLLVKDERVDRKHPAVESGLRWIWWTGEDS